MSNKPVSKKLMFHKPISKVEILAPVGDWSMLVAAIQSGADAVYFGIKGMNMRAAANNFTLTDVKKIVSYCHKHKVKAYCTVNVIIYEKEFKALNKILSVLKKNNIDAVICWDLAVVNECKRLGIPIHLSTQASVSNSQSASLWKEFGVERIVLARETSLDDLKKIKEKAKLEIEVFVHGARCISLSGRCFMSEELFKKSANRGECWQPCRRQYKIIDEENKEMILENNFVMSAKDLCALPLLPKLIAQKVDSLKIEGRNRGPEYVSKVVSVYRRAIDAIYDCSFNETLVNNLMEELKTIYNKDFSRGFLVEYPHHELCEVYGSKATQEKVLIGRVTNYYSKRNIAEIKLDAESVKVGDKISFSGPTTGYIELSVGEMHDDKGKCEMITKGKIFSVIVPSKVRENDKVYLIKKRIS